MGKPDAVIDADFAANFFTTLFGKDTDVRDGRARPPRGREPLAFGVYRDTDNEIVGVMIADIPFAAVSGSVLSLIPPTTTAEALKAGKLSGLMSENFEEVLNICSRFFSTDDRRAVLKEVVYAKVAEGDICQVVKRGAKGTGFDVRVKGYATSKLALFYAE